MDSQRYIISDQPSGNAPRLMLIFHNKLSMAAYENIRRIFGEIIESGKPIVLEGGIDVFQLIDGKWLHLDGSVQLENVPEPNKVNFREFL